MAAITSSAAQPLPAASPASPTVPVSSIVSTTGSDNGSNSGDYYVGVNVRPMTWRKGKSKPKKTTASESRTRVFFDPYHRELIVVRTGSATAKLNLWVSDKASLTWEQYQLNLPSDLDITAAALSPERGLFALRISDKEIKVMDAKNGDVVTARSCRGGSSRMIAAHWVKGEFPLLLFVTNQGVELYSLKGSKYKLKHIKTAPYQINYHWFLMEEGFLLLVDNKSVFQAFRLSSKTISKICKFELDCANTSLDPPEPGQSFDIRQISLCHIYGKMACVFVNERKGQVHLLGLANADAMEQTHVYELHAPGRYDVSVIDNVLLMHHQRDRVTSAFDLRSDAKFALLPQLPIGGWPGVPAIPNVAPGDTTSTAAAIAAAISEYALERGSGVWTFLGPCYLMDCSSDQSEGGLWTLELNFERIAASWPNSKRARLVDFLLKRSSPVAKTLVLKIITQIIVSQSSLSLLSRLFGMINRVCYDAYRQQQLRTGAPSSSSSSPMIPKLTTASTSPIPAVPRIPPSSRPSVAGSGVGSDFVHLRRADSVVQDDSNIPSLLRGDSILPGGRPESASITSNNNDDGKLVVETKDVNTTTTSATNVEMNASGYVIISQADIYTHVFIPAIKLIPPSFLISCLTEYLRSIYRHYLNTEDYLNELLVSLLIADKRYYEFHQYLQYHILNDSLMIAERLLEVSRVYEPAYQLALDMLFRLNAIPQLLTVLLNNLEVQTALKLITPRTPVFDEKGLRPADFLKAAKQTGDDSVFYTTFKFFEQRNYYLRSSASFLHSDDCDAYVAHYERMFRHKERTLSPPYPMSTSSSTITDGNETSDSEDGWSDDDENSDTPRRHGPPPGHAEELARDREAALAAAARVKEAQAKAEEEAAAAAGVAHSAIIAVPSSSPTSPGGAATTAEGVPSSSPPSGSPSSTPHEPTNVPDITARNA